MEKSKVFIIFDHTNDKDIKEQLVGQAKNNDTSFEISDCSIKSPLTADWVEKARAKLKNTDQAVVLCGQNSATSVNVEIELAQQEQVPYCLLKGYKDKECVFPKASKSTDKMHNWTWDTLKQTLAMLGNKTSNQINKKLYANDNESDYHKNLTYQSHLLEQYKAYLSSIENINHYRQTANAFFITVNTVLVSLISYLDLGNSTLSKLYWVISFSGIAISYMWYRLVRYYHDLKHAKLKVIHEIEKKLPISPHAAELEAVNRGEHSKIYLPFTHIEIFVPWVFLMFHLVVLLLILYQNFLT